MEKKIIAIVLVLLSVLPIAANEKSSVNEQTGGSQIYFDLKEEAEGISTSSTPKVAIKGDINGDEAVDSYDVSVLLEMVLSGGLTDEQILLGDINGDGSVDSYDMSAILEIVLSEENPADKPLRILAIGNSFLPNCTRLLSTLQYGARYKINERNCCCYLVSYPGSTVKECLYYLKNNFVSGDRYNHSGQTRTTSASRRFGYLVMPDTDPSYYYGYTGCGLADIVAHDWDIIVLQELSNNVDKYEWLNKDILKEYIDLLRQTCTNKDVKIAWNQPWSHTPEEVNPSFAGIADYTEKLWAEFSTEVVGNPCIDMIIPVGTAIQNARNVFCNPESELYITNNTYMTSDKHHLGQGIAVYVAACTWWDMLIAPWSRVGCLGNPQLELESKRLSAINEMYSLYTGCGWVWGNLYGALYKDEAGNVMGYEDYAAAMGLVEGPSFDESGEMTSDGNITTLQMCAVSAIAEPNKVTDVSVSFDEAKYYFEQWEKTKGNK